MDRCLMGWRNAGLFAGWRSTTLEVFAMMHGLSALFRSFRPLFHQRKQLSLSLPRRTRPLVEALEERYLLAANLIWVGTSQNATWSNMNNWSPRAQPGPADTLTFGGTQGALTNSTDDMSGLSISNLDVKSDYTHIITLNNELIVTGNVSIANGYVQGIGALTVPNGLSTFTWSGGTLLNTTVNLGSSSAQPTLTINGAPSKTLDGTSFFSYANATWIGTGSLSMKNAALFTNEPDAVFDNQADTSMTTDGSATGFNNYGTFKKSAGTQTTGIAVQSFGNSGQMQFLSGTVSFTTANFWQGGAGSRTTLNGGNISTQAGFLLIGGLLEAVAASHITGNVYNVGGTVHPGLGNSPGNLVIFGNYAQGSGGTLVIDFNTSGGYGVLSVQAGGQGGGTATIDGTLTLNRNTYAPTAQAGVFTFLYPLTTVGTFATVNGLSDTWVVNGHTYGWNPLGQAPNGVSVRLIS
jgi:hypothetical protein